MDEPKPGLCAAMAIEQRPRTAASSFLRENANLKVPLRVPRTSRGASTQRYQTSSWPIRPYMGSRKGLKFQRETVSENAVEELQSDLSPHHSFAVLSLVVFLRFPRFFSHVAIRLGMFISSYEGLRRTKFSLQATNYDAVQLEYSGFRGATVPICNILLFRTKATMSKISGRIYPLSRFFVEVKKQKGLMCFLTRSNSAISSPLEAC